MLVGNYCVAADVDVVVVVVVVAIGQENLVWQNSMKVDCCLSYMVITKIFMKCELTKAFKD